MSYGLGYVNKKYQWDIVDSICTHMPPNRGCDYEIPYAFTAKTATYKRAFSTSSTYSSLSLPYSGGTLPNDVKAFKLVSTINIPGSWNNKGLWFLSLDDNRLTGQSDNERNNKLDANTPYILKFNSFDGLGTADANGYYTAFKAMDATVAANTNQKDSIYQVSPAGTAEGWTFGTSPMNVLHAKAVSMNIYNFRASDKSWHPVKGSTESYPEDPVGSTQYGTYYYAHSFRGFMIYSGTGNAAKSFPKIIDSNEPLPTDIKQFKSVDNTNTPYYSIDGTEVSREQLKKHDIYIHDGKKVMW